MAVLIEDGYNLPDANHARIGYQDATQGATIQSSSQGAENPAIAARSWQTYERWRPTASPAFISFHFEETYVNYIGIAAHTLTLASSVVVDIRVQGVWQTVRPSTPWFALDNEAIMLLISPKTITGVRINITYPGEAPTIGKIAAGRVLTMARPFYGGHAPALLNRDTERTPNVSESGEWLGAYIKRQGRRGSASWEHLRANWYRANFDPFVEHAQRNPFFFAWNPRRFPDCVYGMLTSDIVPTNMGIRDFMQVSMSFKVYSDGTIANSTRLPPTWSEHYPEAVEDMDLIDLAINREWPDA